MTTESKEDFLQTILKKEKMLNEMKNARRLLQIKITALETEIDEMKDKYRTQQRKSQDDYKHWSSKKFSWTEDLHAALESTFKFNSFREKQLAAINATMSGLDVILVMPTGGGKSLTYQLPALLSKNVTLVISPLISLITDQIMALDKIGIYAATVNSNSTKAERERIHNEMITRNKDLKIVFVTPEWIVKSKMFFNYLTKCHNRQLLERIVIDEVHCCSTWGHDFRTDYCQLSFLKTSFSGVPILGLTATATIQVLNDVTTILDIPQAIILTAPFNRPNLYYKVIAKPDKESCMNLLEKIITQHYKKKSGIIYCQTIKECEEVVDELRGYGVEAACYHAQLEPARKHKVHERWLMNKYQVVVATIAFGMGIDKPDVRFVVHYSAPKSMEGFYQESGRAGRNGERADCILLFSFNDVLKNLAMSQSRQNDKNALAVLSYCLNVTKCRRKLIATFFQDTWDSNDCNKMCDICDEKKRVRHYNIRRVYLVINIILQTTEEKLTLNKLCKAVTSRMKNDIILTVDEVALIVATLLDQNYLTFSKGANMYSYILYLEHKPDEKRNGVIVLSALHDIYSLEYYQLKPKDLPQELSDTDNTPISSDNDISPKTDSNGNGTPKTNNNSPKTNNNSPKTNNNNGSPNKDKSPKKEMPSLPPSPEPSPKKRKL